MNDNFITIAKNQNIIISGKWTIHNAAKIQEEILKSSYLPTNNKVIIEGNLIEEIDTSGAWVLLSLIKSLSNKNIKIIKKDFQHSHLKIIDIIENIKHSDFLEQKQLPVVH